MIMDKNGKKIEYTDGNFFSTITNVIHRYKLEKVRIL